MKAFLHIPEVMQSLNQLQKIITPLHDCIEGGKHRRIPGGPPTQSLQCRMLSRTPFLPTLPLPLLLGLLGDGLRADTQGQLDVGQALLRVLQNLISNHLLGPAHDIIGEQAEEAIKVGSGGVHSEGVEEGGSK